MKQRNSVVNQKSLVLSAAEYNQLVAFVQILVQIDRRVNLCNGKVQKKAKSTKKPKIASIILDSRNSGSFVFIISAERYA